MALLWCSGLITPMFKSGGRNDPTNYRIILWHGIVSNLRNCSYVRNGFELFCSILNQRLMEQCQLVERTSQFSNRLFTKQPNGRPRSHTNIDK